MKHLVKYEIVGLRTFKSIATFRFFICFVGKCSFVFIHGNVEKFFGVCFGESFHVDSTFVST